MVTALIGAARSFGYRLIVPDGFHRFKTEQRPYRKSGFKDVPPTIDLPELLQGKVVFMGLGLT